MKIYRNYLCFYILHPYSCKLDSESKSENQSSVLATHLARGLVNDIARADRIDDQKKCSA